MEQEQITLPEHEARSQKRYEDVCAQLTALADWAKTPEAKETIMSDSVMDKISINAGGGGMPGYGYGYGGGDIGGLMALALLGGFGNRRDFGNGEACPATQAALTSAIADGINHNINNLGVGVNHNINTSLQGLTNLVNNGFGGQRDLATMGKLCDIEKGIWQAEGQVQLSVAGAQADINNRIADGLQVAVQGQGAIRKDISDAISASLVSQGEIKQTIAMVGATNIAATKDSQYAVTTAVRDDGDKTRALIVRQYEDTLNRELSEARNALVELRSAGRVRESEINITNTNTNTQVQLQAQAQQQQQLQVLAALVAEVRNLANDVQVVRQTQSNVNFGVQGANTQSNAASNNRVG